MTFSCEVDAAPNGLLRIVLSGTLAEEAKSALQACLERPELTQAKLVVIDLGEVRLATSLGIRPWCQFISKLTASTQVELVRISPSMTQVLSSLFDAIGEARVVSVVIPYTCPTCTGAVQVIASAEEIQATCKAPVCACGAEMESEFPEELYETLVSP